MSEPEHDGGMLVLIGVFKLVKVALLVTLGVMAFAEAPVTIAHTLASLTRWTGAFAGRELVQRALGRLLALDERTVHRLGVASLGYAGLFLVEGVGLLKRRRWGEWVTIFITGSFIPLEIYELAHKPSAAKAVAIALNVAIVVYLVWRIRRRR